MSNSIFFEPKSVIFREGEIATSLMIIKSGQALCLKASKERLIPVFFAREQDIVGESAMLKGAPYTYSVISMSRVEVISIPFTDFEEALKSAPDWLSDLATTMVSRFQSTAALISENRVFDPSVLTEEDYTSSIEIEYKKLLS